MRLPDSARALIRSGALGHLVTLGRSGSPQVTCVWVGVDGDDLLTAHLNLAQRKLENVRGDPRVALSFEGTEVRPPGLREYLVVHGRATIEAARRSFSRSWRTSTSGPTSSSRPWRTRRRGCACGSRSIASTGSAPGLTSTSASAGAAPGGAAR
jgi:general stress protein 26